MYFMHFFSFLSLSFSTFHLICILCMLCLSARLPVGLMVNTFLLVRCKRCETCTNPISIMYSSAETFFIYVLMFSHVLFLTFFRHSLSASSHPLRRREMQIRARAREMEVWCCNCRLSCQRYSFYPRVLSHSYTYVLFTARSHHLNNVSDANAFDTLFSISLSLYLPFLLLLLFVWFKVL